MKSYYKNKSRVISLAITWQSNFANQDRSWEYCAKWESVFSKLAKKYGLVREFKENGII